MIAIHQDNFVNLGFDVSLCKLLLFTPEKVPYRQGIHMFANFTSFFLPCEKLAIDI